MASVQPTAGGGSATSVTIPSHGCSAANNALCSIGFCSTASCPAQGLRPSAEDPPTSPTIGRWLASPSRCARMCRVTLKTSMSGSESSISRTSMFLWAHRAMASAPPETHSSTVAASTTSAPDLASNQDPDALKQIPLHSRCKRLRSSANHRSVARVLRERSIPPRRSAAGPEHTTTSSTSRAGETGSIQGSTRPTRRRVPSSRMLRDPSIHGRDRDLTVKASDSNFPEALMSNARRDSEWPRSAIRKTCPASAGSGGIAGHLRRHPDRSRDLGRLDLVCCPDLRRGAGAVRGPRHRHRLVRGSGCRPPSTGW